MPPFHVSVNCEAEKYALIPVCGLSIIYTCFLQFISLTYLNKKEEDLGY